MRFESITIEKYGVFSARTVSLPARPGLVLVYGPNEAGKSTCLAAICDFLFGIPQQSPHGQVFGYGQMRVSAVLRFADGTAISLRRRKGRQDQSLSDDTDRRVDEFVLSRYLGATGRERFATLFGIDHTSLRSGGDRLLAADGEVGRLIVEASGGLRLLVEAMKRLAADADRLFAQRKSADRDYYRALAAFEAADRQVKDGLRTREGFDEALRREKEAVRARTELRQQRSEALEHKLRLQRLVRVIPTLRALEAAESEVASFADLPPLPEDFAVRVRAALGALQAAQDGLREAEGRRASLAAKLDALILPAALLAEESLIRDIAAKSDIVQNARAARPNRLHEQADGEAKLESMRRSVGLRADADLEQLLPSQAVIDQVQRLAGQGRERGATIENLVKQLAYDNATLRTLEERQAERHRSGTVTALGVTASDFSTLTMLSSALERKLSETRKRSETIASRVAALGFASVADLRAWVCPDAAVVQAEIERRAGIDVEIVKLAERIATETAKRDVATEQIGRLMSAGEVPSDDAIAAGRHTRNDVWGAIRDRYISENGTAVAARPLAERSSDVSAFEDRTRDADDLADRKSTEAERIATLELAQRQRADAIGALAVFEQQRDTLDTFRLTREREWRDTWPAATQRHDDPGQLKRLIAERSSLLDDGALLDAAQSEADQMRLGLEPPMSALILAEAGLGLAGTGPATGLAERVAAATRGLKAHELACADFQRDETAIRDARLKIAGTQASLDEHRSVQASWGEAWRKAVQSLGLDEQASPERGTEVATQWAAAAGVLDAVKLTRRRLRRMDEDEAELRRLVHDLEERLDFALPSDSVAAAAMLRERLEAAQKIKIERNSLAPQLSELITERDAKKAALAAAGEAVGALCQQAGCDPELLSAVAGRCDEHHKVLARRRNYIETIASAGDGLSLAVLREQWSGRDLDTVKAELAKIENDDARLNAAEEAASAEVQDRGRALAVFSSQDGINQAVAGRETASAEMHSALRQYVEMILAHDLLSAAMDRVRAEQQDPLVLRAGELFAAATHHAFVGIETDVDNRGDPIVVGKRANGETVHVRAMSDGTRDQLFLAFRIAGIEQYCRAAEPLPFIADDLLVHFDDERSASTLELLAELGTMTQVLLFTHHRGIVETAAKLAEEGRTAFLEMACG